MIVNLHSEVWGFEVVLLAVIVTYSTHDNLVILQDLYSLHIN